MFTYQTQDSREKKRRSDNLITEEKQKGGGGSEAAVLWLESRLRFSVSTSSDERGGEQV